MKIIIVLMTLILMQVASSQELRQVSNSDNNLKRHKQVLASRLLSWSTGSEEQNAYVSVGRYANYFGFVKFRVSSNHSLKRSSAAKETLSLLTHEQQKTLVLIMESQRDQLVKTHNSRLSVNQFLDQLLLEEKAIEDKPIFMELATRYALNEATLGVQLARGLKAVAETLSAEQLVDLKHMRQQYVSGTRNSSKHNPAILRELSRQDRQELINLSARLLSWMTSSLEDISYETIGKPSQHFGFVSMRIESNHGVKRGKLADNVQALFTADQISRLAVDAQKDLQQFQEYLTAREPFLEALLSLRDSGEKSDIKLLELANPMARSEAVMTWSQAMAIKELLTSLDSEQRSKLVNLRNIGTGNSSEGAHVFKQCAMCHQDSSIAPDLTAIIDREVTGTNFPYSPAMKKFSTNNRVWTKELLQRFIGNPARVVPGTTMGYKGLKDVSSQLALIEYLHSRQ